MSLLREIGHELYGMFLGDARLSLGVLALVAIVAALLEAATISTAMAGIGLMAGAMALLVVAAAGEARRRRRDDEAP